MQRRVGDGGRSAGKGAGVVDSGGCRHVVDGDGGVHERRSGDQVLAGAEAGGQEYVGRLARSDEDGIGCEGFRVSGVDFDHGQFMAGDLEEELFVHCSVDDSKQICLSWLYRQCIPTCTKTQQTRILGLVSLLYFKTVI